MYARACWRRAPMRWASVRCLSVPVYALMSSRSDGHPADLSAGRGQVDIRSRARSAQRRAAVARMAAGMAGAGVVVLIPALGVDQLGDVGGPYPWGGLHA